MEILSLSEVVWKQRMEAQTSTLMFKPRLTKNNLQFKTLNLPTTQSGFWGPWSRCFSLQSVIFGALVWTPSSLWSTLSSLCATCQSWASRSLESSTFTSKHLFILLHLTLFQSTSFTNGLIYGTSNGPVKLLSTHHLQELELKTEYSSTSWEAPSCLWRCSLSDNSCWFSSTAAEE